jgi:hypothetical protein
MITRLPFMVGAALALAIAAAFAIGMMRSSRPSLIAKPPPFEQRWQDQQTIPKAVRTIPITPSMQAIPVPEPLVAPPPRAETKQPPPRAAPPRQRVKKREETGRDICRGKGKTWKDNKRYWRCKR